MKETPVANTATTPQGQVAPSVHFSSENQTWETPQYLFDALHSEFNFTLDVCALPHNAKLKRFFSPEQNGLAQSWAGERCFMNPPYGRTIGAWMAKASGSGALVVCLVPARTDTAWWHDYAAQADEIRYFRGRLSFVGAKYGAPFPSAVVIFRPMRHLSPSVDLPHGLRVSKKESPAALSYVSPHDIKEA